MTFLQISPLKPDRFDISEVLDISYGYSATSLALCLDMVMPGHMCSST